jgi:hypothetical protein
MIALHKTSINLFGFNIKRMIYNNLYIWIVERFFYKYIYFISIYFKILSKLFTSINLTTIKIFFISNMGVSAYFLGRYIALKLKKKYSLFFILNPLKRELNYIAKKTRLNEKPYELIDYKLKLNNFIKEHKVKFSIILDKILKIFKRMHFFFYSLYYS